MFNLNLTNNRGVGFTPHLFSQMKKGGGFTLIEVIVAVSVIMTGIVGAFTVTTQIISYTSVSKNQLTATYLAKEGIEIIRNIRDTNYLVRESESIPITPWNWWLPISGDWEADYTQPYGQFLTFCSNSCDYNSPNLHFLKIDGGFYNYTQGQDTKFKRKISFQGAGLDELKVTVTVFWKEKDTVHQVSAQDNLRNWGD